MSPGNISGIAPPRAPLDRPTAGVAAPAWFEEWFDEHYLAVYPHRDECEAERAVSLVARHTGFGPDARVLDLCCGTGRHLHAFARRLGTRPVGVDLSPTLLREARRRLAGAALLVRGDVRALPLAAATFDLVTSLFTSFGYFDDDAEHAELLGAVARLLRPGGWFVLDFLNAPHVRASLRPRNVRRIREQTVTEERIIEHGAAGGEYVVKRITVERAGGYRLTATERVRLFGPKELRALLVAAGLRVTHVCGDYSGRRLTAASPRAILFARAA
jgi:SAM-dependent methyltransferase